MNKQSPSVERESAAEQETASDLSSWQDFRARRDAQLRNNYGFLAQVALLWLDGEPQTFDGLGGRWRVVEDAVLIEPAGATLFGLPDLVPVVEPTRVEVAESGSQIAFQTPEQTRVELIRRSGRFGLRLLSPHSPRLQAFTAVPVFPYDDQFVLDGTWQPETDPSRSVRVGGALPGLVHDLRLVGTAVVDHHGEQQSVLLTGDPSAPSLLFSDESSDRQSAAWRVVPVAVTGDHVVIDFNRAVNFPAGFSAHATCPRPPRANHFRFPITAGERRVEVSAPVRFLSLSLGFNAGSDRVSSKQRLDDIVAQALWAEQAGIDAFAVGEHHTPDTEVSAPPVLLAAIAARTRRIRLFTAVTVLSVLDPVRVYEDYATLDNLSDGRVEIIVGKGNTALQQQVFGHTEDDQWDRIAEKYELLRLLIDNETVSWSGRHRPPLRDFSARPRFLQESPPIWHGSATSTRSTELAARFGDPLFSANVTGRLEQYRDLVADYRHRWRDHGRDPALAVVGAGSAAVHVAPTSQQARAEYEPIFTERQRRVFSFAQQSPFADFDDAIAHGSWFVGSPAQVTEQILRYHEALGHSVQHIGEVELNDPVRRAGIELFTERVIPEMRRRVPAQEPTTDAASAALSTGGSV